MSDSKKTQQVKPTQPSLFSLLAPYKGLISLLVFTSITASGLGLVIPKLVARAIDSFAGGAFNITTLAIEFAVVGVAILIFTYMQGFVQTYASEKVARDLRRQVSDKISGQSYAFVTKVTPAKLLTNLTSDVDAVKSFVSQAVSTMISSLFVIVGAAVLMILINWKLALVVLAVVPLIGGTFAFIFGKVGRLFKKSQEIQDRLNKIITESITGAALVRVVHAQGIELLKFTQTNTDAKETGFRILALFAFMIPAITFFANIAQLVILALGGHLAISGSLSLGDFSAFNAYLALLIFPIIIIGFMSSLISRSQASYSRIAEVLTAPDAITPGTDTSKITGEIVVEKISLDLGGKPILKDVTFALRAGAKAAIMGPTAAGKTQLLYILSGLIHPTSGVVDIDAKSIATYDPATLHAQVGLVFQDSVIFNLTLKENIAFGGEATEEDIEKAIRTAELQDLVASLPQGLETVISERGSNLSGGQKQRIMLARALAIKPKILLLDDFTARVDNETERKILANLAEEFPKITIVSVTQKVASASAFDQIIVLMEGEVIATGTHEELLKRSTEYMQIYESQQSTTDHE